MKFYLVTATGLIQLPLPTERMVTSVHELFDGLPLGVYTSFRTFSHDHFLCLDAHLDRLQTSMDLLGWSFRLDQRGVRRALHQACRDYPFPDARVRIDVLAAPVRWDSTLPSNQDRVTLALSPFSPVPARCYHKGVSVALAPKLRRDIPQAKRADFVMARRAYTDGEQAQFEHLLTDQDGLILEGSSSNFYGIYSGEVWTAGADVLEGVARRLVLQVAGELRIPVKLEAWPVAEVDRLQEAFLSSSSRGIVPIVNIGGQPVGTGRPGTLTRDLMAAYDAQVALMLKPALANPET